MLVTEVLLGLRVFHISIKPTSMSIFKSWPRLVFFSLLISVTMRISDDTLPSQIIHNSGTEYEENHCLEGGLKMKSLVYHKSFCERI